MNNQLTRRADKRNPSGERQGIRLLNEAFRTSLSLLKNVYRFMICMFHRVEVCSELLFEEVNVFQA